ncbi:MAG: hypothetical protein OXB86_01195 [Bdellovibrionales bacterium]|nr:hypothetical protein [Bdellovibrionales bacterium]
MRFATERLTVASVSKPNSLLTPLSSQWRANFMSVKNYKTQTGLM